MSTITENVSSGAEKKPIVQKGSVWVDDRPEASCVYIEVAVTDGDDCDSIRIGFLRSNPKHWTVQSGTVYWNGTLGNVQQQIWPPTQPPDLNIDLLDALTDIHCPDCDHSLRQHVDEYGCEVERGDKWVEGNNCGGMVAQGPCHCKCENRPDLQVAINLLRKIKALQAVQS